MENSGDAMKIVVDVNHPADVHYFKNFIREMRKRGHEILIVASEKDVSYHLLNAYGFDYVKLGSYGKSLVKKAINLLLLDLKMYLAIKKFKPDICVGLGSIRVAHAAYFLNSKSILFETTEHSREQHILYLPFVSTVLTPSWFKKDFGKKQIRFNGYKELAYLRSNRFAPNNSVLTEYGLTEVDPYIIVRFVSWDASHDINQHGIRDKVGMVKALEKYGRVLITSEGLLPTEILPNQIRVSPEKLHDLLYYATLYIGEGGTTATEAALVGTPSIYVSSLVGTMGNFIELEETYDLLHSFTDCHAAMCKAVEILKNPVSKKDWRIKLERLLKDKIDVTAFMIWFVENYPESIDLIKNNQEMQLRFGS